jgi:hypothetical protein
MRGTIKIFVFTLILMVATVGCSTKPENPTFLDDYSKLKTSSWHNKVFIWSAANVDFKNYDRVMVDKIILLGPEGKELTEKRQIYKAITKKMQATIREHVARKFIVTEQPGVRTIRIQAAITSEMAHVYDETKYQFMPLNAIIMRDLRAKNRTDPVVVKFESIMLDSQSNEVIAKVVDKSKGYTHSDPLRGEYKTNFGLEDTIPALSRWANSMKKALLELDVNEKQER